MENEPTLTVPVSERDHTEGDPNAPVTLVEYGDYQCPYCGRAHPVVKRVQAHFGPRLRFVFRNFPLSDLHEYAALAAESAEAAAAQGKFWPMHDKIFENQGALGPELIESIATELGIDLEKFNQEVNGSAYRDRVKQDFMSGVRSGVNGTPTFFLNGTRYNDNPDYPSLVSAIEALL